MKKILILLLAVLGLNSASAQYCDTCSQNNNFILPIMTEVGRLQCAIDNGLNMPILTYEQKKQFDSKNWQELLDEYAYQAVSNGNFVMWVEVESHWGETYNWPIVGFRKWSIGPKKMKVETYWLGRKGTMHRIAWHGPIPSAVLGGDSAWQSNIIDEQAKLVISLDDWNHFASRVMQVM